jgi:hypothetical protein
VGERPRRKYTPDIERFLHGIVAEERLKGRLLGARHKQHMTNVQIYISRATVNTALAKIRKRQKEVHIRQEYELGQRLEYDFGEVRLECGEGMKPCYMAVFCSPAKRVESRPNQDVDVLRLSDERDKLLPQERKRAGKSVDCLRHQLFADTYRFSSLEATQ